MNDFVHLHVHTYYSILDGQSPVKRLVDEHLGFIKFGSRVDVYLPLGTEVCVKMGQKTTGDHTVIAKLK